METLAGVEASGRSRRGAPAPPASCQVGVQRAGLALRVPWMKFYQGTAVPVCLPVIHACFGAVTVELNNHNKGWLAKPEAFTVWTFTENGSRTLVPGTWVLGGGAASRWVKEGVRPPRGAGGVIPGVAVLIRPGAPGQAMLHPVTRT